MVAQEPELTGFQMSQDFDVLLRWSHLSLPSFLWFFFGSHVRLYCGNFVAAFAAKRWCSRGKRFGDGGHHRTIFPGGLFPCVAALRRSIGQFFRKPLLSAWGRTAATAERISRCLLFREASRGLALPTSFQPSFRHASIFSTLA